MNTITEKNGVYFGSTALGQPGSAIGAESGHDPSGCGVRMAQYARYTQENLVRKFATIFF